MYMYLALLTENKKKNAQIYNNLIIVECENLSSSIYQFPRSRISRNSFSRVEAGRNVEVTNTETEIFPFDLCPKYEARGPCS